MKLRLYDQEGYKLRAGCLCYRDRTEKEVLLVSGGSKNRNSWKVPAGGIENGEIPMDAAIREVFEEAGVTGEVGICLGLFQNEKSKSRTYIYSMFVKTLNKSMENKDCKWFDVSEAHTYLTQRPIQQQYITTAMNHRKMLVKDPNTNTYKPLYKNEKT